MRRPYKNKKQEIKNHLTLFFIFAIFIVSFLNGNISQAATPAGYSEFYIPGDEDIMGQVFADIGAAGGAGLTDPRHTVINVVGWSPNTTIYYDHWEHCNGIPVGSLGCTDGYNFDPNNPATADET